MAKLWKKGRGKLGGFQPLLGRWIAQADSEMGPVRCTRELRSTLGGHYLELHVRWEFGAKGGGRAYEETAIIGPGDDGVVSFWSFTSDGKRSAGRLAEVSDLHPEAIGFEAQMPAGLARQGYWPAGDGGFFWVVESKNKSGWKRFVQHHYHAE